jgi:hypothetical protein
MSITFGRFSDAFKPLAKAEFWTKCEKAFEAKNYTESYLAFFSYLKDDEANNVTITQAGDTINFEFLQGSQIVKGTIGNNKVIAEAFVASYDKLSVAFMRRLMDINYSLYYSRFCLKDNKIVIKFDSSIADGPPRKLYYAFKEVATRADKQDNLLSEDFTMLKSIGSAAVEQIPEAEKELKYNYFKSFIEGTINHIAQLNEDKISGGISYLLLNLLYKLDYLIVPEGNLMNELEKISWGYFAKDNKPYIQKNTDMKNAFVKLLAIPKEKIVADIYRTKSTFGIANAVPQQGVVDVFNNNINNIKWYADNHYEDIAITIYEYLATYCLFSYGLPKPTRGLFHLLVNVTSQQFFTDLGLKEIYYDIPNKKPNAELIKGEIDRIIKEGNQQYPELKVKNENLKFDSLINFLRTYITEIQNLNYNN